MAHGQELEFAPDVICVTDKWLHNFETLAFNPTGSIATTEILIFLDHIEFIPSNDKWLHNVDKNISYVFHQ